MVDLFQWPDTSKVDRAIPKERLYTEVSAGAALKQRFVDQVKRIRWAYKLGDESLHLSPGENVTEIQVFVVELKGSNLDNSVLAAIDKAIPSQIFFELRREVGQRAEQAMAAAYKRSGGKTKGNDYFHTGWVSADHPRIPLPAALDLDGLYGRLLGSLFPHPIGPGEDLSDALDRMGRIRSLSREIAALEKKMRTEPQLNRKMDLRTQIRERSAVRTELINPALSIKD